MLQFPLVSICVAVYNVDLWLCSCLNSIMKQTYKNWECLIINDGSTDNSLSIAQKFCDNDSRFHLINKMNGGVSTVRNVGIEHSHGEFIFFVDGDDMLMPDCLEYCIHAIGKADILVANCIVINTLGKVIGHKNQGEDRYLDQERALKEYLNRIILTSVWSKLYRRKIIGNVRFNVKLTSGEDLHFNTNLLLQNENLCVKVTNHPIYYYRIIRTSISHIKGEERMKRLISQIKEMDVLYEENRKVINRCYLDEYACNMIRDILSIYYLQGILKRTESWCVPFLSKYNRLITNKKSKEYKRSQFILTHSSSMVSLVTTLREIPYTLKCIIKEIIAK